MAERGSDFDGERISAAFGAEERTCATALDGVELSERDFLRLLHLLENPPPPTARLRRALKAGFVLADHEAGEDQN